MKKGVTTLIVVVGVLVVLGVVAYLLYEPEYMQDNQEGMQQETEEPEQQTESDNEVSIQNFEYTPSSITIDSGDTVTWTNLDDARHTVTSDTGNELDSDLLSNGETYEHTFTEAGTFAYHCTPHPYMKGTVIVE